ncbi:cilia- and flagella-associated protein 99 [Melospiza melodia melodia]|uniref:cilia- and flagella-associated protein 99 n=1 Tax=Melospiza melodia melodia TaxID=1914991 RepID=UPI002FD7005A
MGSAGNSRERQRQRRGQPGAAAAAAVQGRCGRFSMVKMVSHRELIALIVQHLNKFNPENQSLEDFLNESAVIQTLNVTEEKFVLDTLAGCTEYKSILDVVVNAFYVRDGRYCPISERNLYIVICYLATFQLEEIGLQHFSRIVKSLDTAKMQQFLRFFFNDLHLNTWIKDEWSHIYDSVYVKENLIDPLLRWQPKVQQLIEKLTDNLSNRSSTVKTSRVTQPKEFNLTAPKPRAIPPPSPAPLPVLPKRQPVPPSIYKPPKERKQLEEIKTKNIRKAKDLLLEANTNQFRCAAIKPEKRENIHDSMESKPVFKAQKIQSKIDNIPIKLNTAAILREGALYQRKLEEELKRVENLQQGAGDSSEFLEWQKQMRGKDLEDQLAEIECRKLQGKLSYEEAVLAHQNVTQENKKKADLLREEKAELMHLCAEKRLQEQKEMKELVEQVMEGHKNVKQVKEKIQEYKQQIVQQVCEESGELLRQALEEQEEKNRKRYELIQQIRALESAPSIRHKFVDLTETGGHGLFGEMSVVELRERLALLKEAQKAAEEEKRDQIIHEKQAKEQLILDKLDQISQFRAELGRAAAFKQEEKKKSQPGERPMKDERILNLQKKIVEKTMERKKQAGLLKISPQKTRIVPSKDSFQWNHWKELEESRERQFRMLQHGFMDREAVQKKELIAAARTGAKACILRSDLK